MDLTAQYAALKDELLAAVEAVMDSQKFINGPAVKELEGLVAEYCQTAAAIGVSSGTDALLLSLMAMGIGAGDEVITSPYTFFATVGAIARTGAKPVFVDIEAETFNINPALIPAAVTDRTKAIIPVHLFGQTADMDPILALAAERGLAVIEDAAQAIGAVYKGHRAGAMGTVGCFSFYPTKNLGGLGDGGMIVTNDPQLADRLTRGRNHGQNPKYFYSWVGGNFRLDTIQAACLIIKLRYLDDWSAKRRRNAARYDELFADCDAVVTPVVREGNVSIFNQYIVRVGRRDELLAHLRSCNVGCGIYYPLSLHLQECFKGLGYKQGDFPESERATAESLALPIYPELTVEQIGFVVETVKKFLA